MNILFITSSRIGDAVLSSGLLAHFAARYPNARITVACGPAAAPLFDAAPQVERIIVMNKRKWGGHWLDLWRDCIRQPGGWSLVVDLRGSAIAFSCSPGVAGSIGARPAGVTACMPWPGPFGSRRRRRPVCGPIAAMKAKPRG